MKRAGREVCASSWEKLDNSDFREEMVSRIRKCLASGHTASPLPCSHLCESYFWSVKVPKENVVSASEIQNVLCACQICAKGKSFIATLYYCSIIFRLNFCIIFQTLSFDRATFYSVGLMKYTCLPANPLLVLLFLPCSYWWRQLL